MKRKKSLTEDVYYWFSILLIVTGAGYFIAQGVDTDASLPAPIEADGRLEAFRQTIIDSDVPNMVVIEDETQIDDEIIELVP